MNVVAKIFCYFLLFTIFAACGKDNSPAPTQNVQLLDPVAIQKTNGMKIFIHYMVWFDSKESSGTGKWGAHWTMSNQDPDIIDANGKRQIASYFYPSIGPYASGDQFVIEYHLLLMKYAGVDGVIMDWYGVHDVYDYAGIRKNTESVVNMIGKTGLQFAVCYEDQTLDAVVKQNAATSSVSGAQNDMDYLKSKFFSKSSYIKINNEPLLLVFGPQILKTADNWSEAFLGLTTKPCFLTLWNQSSQAGSNSRGEFAWVYKNDTYLDNFYSTNVPKLAVAMGGAYPGFKDFYAAGGNGAGLGWTIDSNNGATLTQTLQKAKSANMSYVQIATWNDFGEGTIVEPTNEFGYQYLQIIKDFGGVTGYDNTFENIKRQYDLRVKYKSNAAAQKSLDQSFNYFVSLQHEKAAHVLDSLQNIIH